MPETDPILLLVLLVSSTIAAVLAVLFVTWILARNKAAVGLNTVRSERTHSYVFRNGYLVSDVSEPDPLLVNPKDRAGAWSSLSEVLVRTNPQLRSAPDGLQRSGQSFLMTGAAGEDMLSVSGTVEGDMLRVTVSNIGADDDKLVVDAESYRRHRSETETLRSIADAIPVVSWCEAEDGRITWANAGYFRFLEAIGGDPSAARWPPRQLFGKDIRPLPEKGQSRRCALTLKDRREPVWFEVTAQALGAQTLLAATPADRLVAAEDALREFVQTLSKTFADLPIGLAIFDRRRELVLFNPAMVSLSTLDAQFLSGRPTLYAFLDQLREKRQMPEPRNYKTWRERIAKLEADAEEGTYHDLWTLPMGQTYRVIGRPHPGGAIAFMFEDISSEVSLTRQFRADLDLYQAAIDQNEAAIAVFSAQGQLVMSNSAYATLWGHDPRELLGVLTLTEATQRWQQATMPAPLWGEIRDFSQQRQDRVIWTDLLRLPDGRELFTQVSPLRGGATMLSFELQADGHVLATPALGTGEAASEQMIAGDPPLEDG